MECWLFERPPNISFFLYSNTLGVTCSLLPHLRGQRDSKRKLNIVKYSFLFLPLILYPVTTPNFTHGNLLFDSILYWAQLLTIFITPFSPPVQCFCITAMHISTWLLAKFNFLYANGKILCNNVNYHIFLLFTAMQEQVH